MSDIVPTLRAMRLCPTICGAAADEIERLRSDIALQADKIRELTDELEDLREKVPAPAPDPF